VSSQRRYPKASAKELARDAMATAGSLSFAVMLLADAVVALAQNQHQPKDG
jgi:sulfur relay (sulfurtransferase) DsrF/TusC family protein